MKNTLQSIYRKVACVWRDRVSAPTYMADLYQNKTRKIWTKLPELQRPTIFICRQLNKPRVNIKRRWNLQSPLQIPAQALPCARAHTHPRMPAGTLISHQGDYPAHNSLRAFICTIFHSGAQRWQLYNSHAADADCLSRGNPAKPHCAERDGRMKQTERQTTGRMRASVFLGRDKKKESEGERERRPCRLRGAGDAGCVLTRAQPNNRHFVSRQPAA